MYHFDYVEGVAPNGNKYKIRIRFLEDRGGFYVDDIGIIEKGKRKEIYLTHALRDDYFYRKMNTGDRWKAEMKMFIDAVGEDAINNALLEVWNKKRPKLIVKCDFDISMK